MNGTRRLVGAEADLVRGAIGMMTDQLVAEFREECEAYRHEIPWFDDWDCDQRIWLLEQATLALLSPSVTLPRSAMLEATIDAIFCEILDLIRLEMDEDFDTDDASLRSWRASVLAAIPIEATRQARASTDELEWGRRVAIVADRILGPTTYDKAESYRDGDIGATARFLQSRGVPEDFLTQIPPVPTHEQTQASIDEIQRWVFQG